MNKFIFPLFLGLLFAACQNTPKNAAESTVPALPPAPAAPVPASPEDLQQASANLTTGVKMMEELRKQADALPAKLKKEKAAEIAVIYSNIEGMIEKQTGMLNEIKAAAAPASESAGAAQETGVSVALNADQVKDYNDSAASYAKEAQAMQETLNKLTKKD